MSRAIGAWFERFTMGDPERGERKVRWRGARRLLLYGLRHPWFRWACCVAAGAVMTVGGTYRAGSWGDTPAEAWPSAAIAGVIVGASAEWRWRRFGRRLKNDR